MGSNLPTPNQHMNTLYRQTYNTLGTITAAGLTQNNIVGDAQKQNNTRLGNTTNKGILAGSVIAVLGSGTVGPCAGDSTVYDKAVGIAVNDAVGNPFESSSAVASNKVVYLHGTGSVFTTDIYEIRKPDGTLLVAYTAGDKLYSSIHGLLTNYQGMTLDTTATLANVGNLTQVGIVLVEPAAANNYFMTVQMKV